MTREPPSLKRLLWVWRINLVLAVGSAGLLVDDLRDGVGGIPLAGRILLTLGWSVLAVTYRVQVHRRRAADRSAS